MGRESLERLSREALLEELEHLHRRIEWLERELRLAQQHAERSEEMRENSQRLMRAELRTRIRVEEELLRKQRREVLRAKAEALLEATEEREDGELSIFRVRESLGIAEIPQPEEAQPAPETQPVKHWLTVEDVSKIWGVTEATVKEWCRNGAIPAVGIGGRRKTWAFDAEALAEWTKGRALENTQKTEDGGNGSG